MKKNNINIIKTLLQDNNVNHYTKLLIYLNTLDYYNDYYIPNKKLMNYCSMSQRTTMMLLKKLEENKIINIYYKKNKRYFYFISQEDEESQKKLNEPFDYNWLEDYE